MNNYTIILAHGIARFDFFLQRFAKDLHTLGINLGLADNELHYFKGISRHLRNHGFNVYQSTVSFSAGLNQRGNDLKKEVETALNLRPEKSKVHIIGHSMGGLDARFMISKLGMADKVASLTTIGTPHNGTSFADWCIANEADELIESFRNCINLDGFADLTTTACATFNNLVQADEIANGVVYQTYSAVDERKNIFEPLKLSWDIINANEGENDGLVPRQSQQWTTELNDSNGNSKPIHQFDFPISADHLNEVGWWDLNQLQFTDLGNLVKAVTNYENSIKNVYLEIANKVRLLD